MNAADGDDKSIALADIERTSRVDDFSCRTPKVTRRPKSLPEALDTDELSAKTMESRKITGLFFIGEVVDVTGHLGGFNFQWAWASGAAAGRAL